MAIWCWSGGFRDARRCRPKSPFDYWHDRVQLTNLKRLGAREHVTTQELRHECTNYDELRRLKAVQELDELERCRVIAIIKYECTAKVLQRRTGLLRDYARQHPRWGYRRAYVDARNDGWQVNHKKIQRLWVEEGLRVVVKRRRKRVGVSTVPAVVAKSAGDVWSIDFQFDSTITGKPVKILSIVDEHTRECLGGIVDYSITGLDLAEQLDVLAIDRGTPRALRMDNGPELISNAVAQWASETGRLFIPPGQPWRNGFIESFNGKLRDECLSINQFYSLNHAKGIIGLWKEEYNTIRPHSSLGNKTPSVYAGQCTH